MQTKDDIRRKTRIIQIDQMLRGGAYVKMDSLVQKFEVSQRTIERDFERLRDDLNAPLEYDKIKNALDEVESTGYGIIMPDIDELKLQEPEIIKQGGRYGVRLSASAPSIHMIKANIQTEVAPIVGTESQSEELVKYLLAGFEEDPTKIWESNIFGKSLNDLVNEGLRSKLFHMPNEARMKMQETLERVINEGCNGLICIIL